jgi:hypothetical protein
MRYDDFTVGYRNEDFGAALRLEGLLEQRGAEVDQAASELGGLYARRIARTAAGTAMLAGFITMVFESLRTYLVDRTLDHAEPLLLGSWAAGALVYGVTYALMRLRFPGTLLPTVDLGHGPRADMERVEAAAPAREARAKIDRLEQDSVAFPMMGVALLAPLTLHWLVMVALPSALDHHRPLGATSFGSWIGMSLVIVGHCHVAVAALAWRFAKRVRALSTLELSVARHGGWSAYGWTLVSSLPVAILLLIPTTLVAITGVFFIPGMFALMHKRLLAERVMLAEA